MEITREIRRPVTPPKNDSPPKADEGKEPERAAAANDSPPSTGGRSLPPSNDRANDRSDDRPDDRQSLDPGEMSRTMFEAGQAITTNLNGRGRDIPRTGEGTKVVIIDEAGRIGRTEDILSGNRIEDIASQADITREAADLPEPQAASINSIEDLKENLTDFYSKDIRSAASDIDRVIANNPDADALLINRGVSTQTITDQILDLVQQSDKIKGFFAGGNLQDAYQRVIDFANSVTQSDDFKDAEKDYEQAVSRATREGVGIIVGAGNAQAPAGMNLPDDFNFNRLAKPDDAIVVGGERDGEVSNLSPRGDVDLVADAFEVSKGQTLFSNNFSAADVAGAYLLIKQANPNLTPRQIEQILKTSGTRIDDANGRGDRGLDIDAALKAAQDLARPSRTRLATRPANS